MSHRLSRAVKIIKEGGKKYPEEKNRFCSAEASWAPPERAREMGGGIASLGSTPQPPVPGQAVLCTMKQTTAVQALRNDPSKGFILPRTAGLSQGAPHVRDSGLVPLTHKQGGTMTRVTTRSSPARATEVTGGEAVPPQSMTPWQPWGAAQDNMQPSAEGVTEKGTDSGTY